jgi:hypothetical protein
MSRLTLRGIAIELGCFGLFAVAYYAPFIFEPSELAIAETRVQLLLDEALAVPAVQFELARNALGHLILLALCYGILVGLAHRFSIATQIAPAVSRFLFLVTGWMLLVAGNAALFPISDYSFMFHALAKPSLALVLAVMLSMGTALALWRTLNNLPLRPWLALAGVLGLAIILVGADFEHTGDKPAPGARNIIIVGVDSLSAVTFDAARQYLPNLAQLLDHATTFDHAYTPLGRTSSAWTSILSGVSPAEHGAIFNLRNMDHVKRETLFPHALRAQGYRTVFAIDERRFANIDESFGFDRVVGPKAGALDFVLQRINDTPLTNLLLQTRLANVFLPFSYLNTASHANYDAKGFVEETIAATSNVQKLFLAVHFESAHFPFKSRHVQRKITSANSFWTRHVGALTVVDTQVGQLMAALAARGYLDNALVIVLSDHGEALGELEAQTTQAGEPLDITGYGHGSNVLSEHQNRIVFGLIPFQAGHPVQGVATRRDDLVSLLNVRGVVERFAASGAVSLTPSIDHCLPVETGIRGSFLSNYHTLKESEVVAESAGNYEINAAGRLQLRESILELLVASKDVGWRCRDRLTYFKNQEQRYFAYSMTDNGRQMIEIEPHPADIAQIEAYRERLSQVPKL